MYQQCTSKLDYLKKPNVYDGKLILLSTIWANSSEPTMTICLYEGFASLIIDTNYCFLRPNENVIIQIFSEWVIAVYIMSNFSAISWHKQIIFQWNDDVCLVGF